MNIAKYTFQNSMPVIPTFNSGYTYTYTDVNNGDGTKTRTITSDSLPTSINFKGQSGLIAVDELNINGLTSLSEIFYRCSALTRINISDWDTTNITRMDNMFSYCYNLTELDLSSFNTSNVTRLDYMFYECTGLVSVNLNNWNTENMTTVRQMFYNCTNLESLKFNSFNNKKITDTYGMFYNCNNLISINILTSNVNSINTIISELPVRSLNTCGTLKSGVVLASDCNIDIAKTKNWNIENDNIIAVYTFNKSTDTLPTFNNDFTNYYCADIDNGNDTITRTIANGDNTSPTNIGFTYKTGLVSLSYLNTSNVTDMKNLFYACPNLTSLDVSSFDTGKVTNMRSMFFNCPNLETITGLTNWDTRNVTNMNLMFYLCSKLSELDLSSWNTKNVTNMGSMFNSCESLSVLNLSNFNTDNVTEISSMFCNCPNLVSLNISGFDVSKAYSIYEMFADCTSLTSLDMCDFNIGDTTVTDYMFDDCNSLISINMEGSNAKTINKVISKLPSKTSNNKGTLIVPNPKDDAIISSYAQSIYWNLEAPPQYAFDIDTITYFISKIKEKFAAISELRNKVDKEEGKNLSTNNFSNEEKDHVENSFNDVTLVDNILVFYSTSESGDKIIVKTFDLDI